MNEPAGGHVPFATSDLVHFHFASCQTPRASHSTSQLSTRFFVSNLCTASKHPLWHSRKASEMLLTGDVEVFVVRPIQRHDYDVEYVSKNAASGKEQSFVSVADGEEYYISIVFGRDFNISPPQVDQGLNHKVSACRIRISIDEGIAVQERVFKLPEVDRGPRVQCIMAFSSASNSSSGVVHQCRPHFAAIPKGKYSQLLYHAILS